MMIMMNNNNYEEKENEDDGRRGVDIDVDAHTSTDNNKHLHTIINNNPPYCFDATTTTRRTILVASAFLPVPLLVGRRSILPSMMIASAAADESVCLNNIEVHKRAAQCQASGLGIIDIEKGTGLQPQVGQTVAVHYTGWLDGFGESRLGEGESEKLFDSSYDRRTPLTFAIGTGTVIKGWDEAVLSMKVGGKRRIIVPPELGYGDKPKGPIPGGSTLYFDVELMKVL